MVHIKPQSIVVKQLESPQEPAIASACGCKQRLWAKLSVRSQRSSLQEQHLPLIAQNELTKRLFQSQRCIRPEQAQD